MLVENTKKRKSTLNRILLYFKTEAQFLLFLFKPRCKPHFSGQTKLLAAMAHSAGSGAGALAQMGRAMGPGSLPNDPSMPSDSTIRRFLDANSRTGEIDVGELFVSNN